MDPADWQKIQAVFHQARELEEHERDAYVRNNLSEDLQREVFSLLQAEAEPTGVLHNPIAKIADSLGPDTLVGNYRIVESIGTGGMGSVYLAERADGAFDRKVALKVVSRGMDTVSVISRFEQERAILGRLDHPNIAGILDGGITDDGRPYVVMEYVDGIPINQYCDENNLSVRERLQVFKHVCDAVQYAHQSLIVHRDLKPSNILVPITGMPKLLDFGIAKILAEQEDPNLTQTGMLLATPAYAAPEQLTSGDITTMTDVYALGVLLYELLSGRRPYEARRTPEEHRQLILASEPLRPSTALTQQPAEEERDDLVQTIARTRSTEITRLRSSLKGDLDNICLMAIMREPELRYATAAALGEDIARHLAGQPVSAQAQSLTYRARKFYSRNRGPVLASAAALLAAIGFGVYHTERITAERDIAIEQQEKTQQVVEFVTGLFLAADPAQAKGENITARELLEAGRRQIETAIADQPEVQATLQRVLGEVHYELGMQDTAGALLREALQTQSEVYGENHLETAKTLLAYGIQQQTVGAFESAVEFIDRASAIRQTLLDSSDPAVIEALSAQAFYQETVGNYDQAERLHNQALSLARAQSSSKGGELVAQQMAKLASLLRLQDRLDEAVALLREALATQDRVYGGAHPESDETKRQLAELLADRRQFEEAEILYKELLASRTKMLGADHYETGSAWNSYGHLLSAMGNIAGAIDAYNRMLAITRKSSGDTHPALAAGYNNVAILQRNLENLDEAVEGFQLSLAMQDAVGIDPEHPNRAYPIAGLGRVYLLQRRYNEAAIEIERAWDIRRKQFADDHILIIELKGDLGAIYAELGRTAEAEPLLVESYNHVQENWGNEDPRTGLTAGRLLRLYELTDEPEKADQYRDIATPREDDIMLRYY